MGYNRSGERRKKREKRRNKHLKRLAAKATAAPDSASQKK